MIPSLYWVWSLLSDIPELIPGSQARPSGGDSETVCHFFPETSPAGRRAFRQFLLLSDKCHMLRVQKDTFR